MRTTLSIDDDVFEAVRYLAEQRKMALGKVLSELARQGLQNQQQAYTSSEGFPVFKVAEGASPITPDHVKRLDDEP